MKTLFEKYFADLDAAKAFANEQNDILSKKDYEHFICAVWDAHNDCHFENGKYMRWCVIADVWDK